jgi:hypothetical protein
MKKHKWYDVMVAYANGEPIQCFLLDKNPEGKWIDYSDSIHPECMPSFNNPMYSWRVKPTIITKWQFLYKQHDESEWKLSTQYYETLEKFLDYFNADQSKYEFLRCEQTKRDIEIRKDKR